MLRAMAHPSEAKTKLARDPVCGMSVDPETAKEKVEFEGTTYYFCSAGCRSAFEKDPSRYAGQSVQIEQPGHLCAVGQDVDGGKSPWARTTGRPTNRPGTASR